ncbi:MAG TPA: DNA repair protein RecN [Chthoniobacteraceae bacterium]|jgi:DNA repair protein RecN (Recombination protein N)|nr:DNA repair protein RecN [Chthoniobacteraceae bacterium]
MLASLRIRNLALVEDLEWALGPGFTAVTGETGSGKSIIIGALKLLLGERADKTLIRTGADACTVEALFHMEDAAAMNARLEAAGVEPCQEGELILKRSFTAAGTNRQFANGSPTTLAVLKDIGDLLVDLHGPHDHQSLLSNESQLDLLDAYAAAGAARANYATQYAALHALLGEHAELSASEASLEREVDLLRHQVAEIEAAQLQPGEEESALARYAVASNSRRLIEISTAILQRVSEADDSLLSGLGEVQRQFRELERLDPAAGPLAQAHANAVIELEECARSTQHYLDSLEIDPAQLAALEERVSLFETLKRKYGATVEQVITFGHDAAQRLRKIESRGEELERLDRDIAAAREKLAALGAKLTKQRAAAAPKLATDIQAQLRGLGFKKSEFAVTLRAGEKPSAHGLEAAEFLFAPNPGEPAKPLKLIASSGEISRVMLAVKSALAAQDRIPLLVFDEIDANVGGEIAHAVGAKMRSLGAAHQVLCITHLPQVAAAAAAQYVVAKQYIGDRTISQLTEVNGKARIEEIARMLGGKTDSALAHARTLLEASA